MAHVNSCQGCPWARGPPVGAVPGAPRGPRPQEDREVPFLCSECARFFALGAPLGPRPLEDREVPVRCSQCARFFAPGAPLGPRPLEDREVPVEGSPSARPCVPGAALGPRPLQHRQTPALSSVLADAPLEIIQRPPFEDAPHHPGPRHARRRVRPARPRHHPPRELTLPRRLRGPRPGRRPAPADHAEPQAAARGPGPRHLLVISLALTLSLSPPSLYIYI